MAKISKILYIVTQSEFGGAQRYVFDLATNLPRENFEIAIAAGGNGSLFEKLGSKDIKTYKLNYLIRSINPIYDLIVIFEILKLLIKYKPDIIHLNSSKASIVGSFASALYRIKKKHKLIYSVHGFVFNEPLPKVIKYFYYLAERLSAIFKDKLIFIYQADMDKAAKIKVASPEKFELIYNGVEKIDYLPRDQARNELKLPTDSLIIGNIANFYPTKGLPYLVKAAGIVCQKIPNAIFVLIGDGLERKSIEAEIKKLSLENKFLLLGKIDQAPKLLKAFDIFALSSVKEGLPYSLLEAMQAGLACVATSVGGNSEIITNEKNGLLIKPANEIDLANAIFNLGQNDILRKNIGRLAEIDTPQKFSLEKMVSKTIDIYQK